MYSEENYLPLSGLQHFMFCRRQWALIHIEQQWVENELTAEGRIMHEKAHSEEREKRGDKLIVRGLRVHSSRLGTIGQCDVVEFQESLNGISLTDREGLYLPYPVEYKRGSSMVNDADRAQLCAQAMCLEEMLSIDIREGALFYGETRRREIVSFPDELRDKVTRAFEEMHELYARAYTPKVKTGAYCRNCSLNELCLPKLMKVKSVAKYVEAALCEDC